MAGLAATLDERLRGVAEELGGRLEALARSAHEGIGDELETKLDGFAARLTGPLGIGGVLQAVEGLRGALDLEPQLDGLATRIESSLASSSDRTPDIEQKLSTIEARLEELRVVAFEPQAPVGLAEIVAAARETSSSEALGLAVMLDERLRGVVDEVGGRFDALAASAPNGDIEEKLSNIEAGLEELRVTAREPQTSADLDGLAGILDERLRGVVDEVGGRLDALAASAPNGDIEQKLSSIEARLADTSSAERQTAELSAIRETLEGLRAESFSATDSQPAPVDFTGVYEAIGQLRSDLADVASREPATIDLAGLHEQFAVLRSDLAGRESALATADNTHDAVVDLRTSFVALAELVKELKPAIDRVATATPSMDERFDGLHGVGRRADRGVRGREWRRAAHGAGDSRIQGLRSDRRPPRCSRRPVVQIERSSATSSFARKLRERSAGSASASTSSSNG